RALAQHARERVLAAAFELDEGLRLVVAGEGRRLTEAGRPEPVAQRDGTRLVQRVSAVHRDVQRDDGEGLWEVAHPDGHGGSRGEREDDPDCRTSHMARNTTTLVAGVTARTDPRRERAAACGPPAER